jgi:nitrate reductase NapE component
MDPQTVSSMKTTNVILDFVLVAVSIWMVLSVRGVGGMVGRTLNLIVIGAIILGIAHLLADIGTGFLGILSLDPTLNNLIHRVIVLLGFIFLIIGFRQIGELKR